MDPEGLLDVEQNQGETGAMTVVAVVLACQGRAFLVVVAKLCLVLVDKWGLNQEPSEPGDLECGLLVVVLLLEQEVVAW